MLCDYGCGREAKYTFKNKKNCCSKMTAHCPAMKKRCSQGLKRAYKKGGRPKKTILPKKKCFFCGNMITINNFDRHEKSCKCNKGKLCPVCGKPTKFGATTCSRECRLIYFGPPNIPDDSKLKGHRTICFRHHEKKCIICGEEYFVDVHHYDKNTENNDPRNLIPICILHHKYTHHPILTYIVKECIDEYVAKWVSS